MKSIRWGILAPGRIATKFATGLNTLTDAKIQAVGSRSLEKAQAFAGQFGIPNVHGSYQALAEDPEVDVVYVANPHNFHRQNVLRCLEAGKPVLCEKPIGVNYQDAKAMFDKAEEKGLFLMEAMWTRFLPGIVRIREWIAEGRIGRVKQLYADFGYSGTTDPNHRILNPHLAGGALLDVGIYPIAFAYMIFGEDPVHISSHADIESTGVDGQSAYLFGYPGGRFALLSSAVQTDSPCRAVIAGTKGRIEIPLFWRASEASIVRDREAHVLHHEKFPFESTGLQYQAVEVMRCLREGKTQSEIMPWSESLRMAQTMDTLRDQWSMRYPFE